MDPWETVRALNRAWAVEGDCDRLRDYFHPDMVAITATDRDLLKGREACIAAWRKFVESAKVLRWTERDPDVRFFRDSIAVVTYYYELSAEIGGRKTDLAGRDMFVLVREGGRWWVAADHFSPLPSPSAD